ncbi:predicted protein [Uncinocarpus reesii 1704]|uniref:Ferritin n=1 Tax=Uncinocarpus reesii (strain UAMH 1704) TaxID=336963 RepID=C4JJV2_UNCRE|nr:uncharacterized protein UREG_01909 [Uncinocarpus reesii 1704]EEP77060.1 predicted protein [Uncinocarpus reesii 1704]
MSSKEDAAKIISEISSQNIDELVRGSTFTNEVEESIRGHIHSELDAWFLFRKLAGDCARANISLHGFAMLWERCAAESFIEAHWLEKYLIQRGGRSRPTAIAAPKCEWPDSPVEPVRPVKEALETHKSLLEDLERLCSLADNMP